MRALLVVLAIAACGNDATTPREVARATPDYAPLGGGTVIVLEGAGFGPSDRVLVDGREAPLVHVIDDTRLELVVPPGEQPGDVELVVFGPTGTASSGELFHYSVAPTVTSVSPFDVASTSADTVVTVTGTGFTGENAGEPIVLVDGQPLAGAITISDTTLTFIAPAGIPFVHPSVEIINSRGRGALSRAFRYTPSASPGLLLFTRWGGSFAVFYDPVTQTSVPIPARASAGRFRSVWRDADGNYWAMNLANEVGQLDLETQSLISPVFVPTRLPALTRVGTRVLGLARDGGAGRSFGEVDVTTGAFVPIGTTTLVCCGSFGIATDGTTVWITGLSDFVTAMINTIDPVTGATGTPVTLTGASGRIEELRYYNGVLYAGTTASQLVTIDPQTGAVTRLLSAPERFSAIEPYD